MNNVYQEEYIHLNIYECITCNWGTQFIWYTYKEWAIWYKDMQWNASLTLYENWTGMLYEPNYQSH